MDDNWGYVAAGYLITATVLIAYVLFLKQRLKRARRSLPTDLDA